MPIYTLLKIHSEKVDGANVGVHFEEQWQPICQKRGGVLAAHEKPQYDVFRNWTFEHMEELWDVLHTDYCMFGEWLWRYRGCERLAYILQHALSALQRFARFFYSF